MGEAARRMSANDDEPRIGLGGDERLSVLLAATVQSGHNIIPVRLREVSRFSALVQAAALPPVGSIVRFCRGEIEVNARVVWAGRASFELQFRELIEERELLIAIGGRKPKAGPPRAKAIFPAENYIGFLDLDDEDDNELPISKH